MVDFNEFHWHSDWDGHEVGLDDVKVVGLYTMKDYPIDVYIDIDKGEIVEAWCNNCEEDW